jgi:elongation factor G
VLDAVVDYLPSPLDLPSAKGTQPEDRRSRRAPRFRRRAVCALVFKLQTDPFVGAADVLPRLFGHARSGLIRLQREDRQERARRPHRASPSRQARRGQRSLRGEIAAAVGLKDTKTSHTLCDEAHPIVLEEIKFPEPVVSLRIEPKTKADQEKMGIALRSSPTKTRPSASKPMKKPARPSSRHG